MDDEYQAVRARFLRPDGRRTWNKWYCKSLRDLARDIDREDEYKRFYAYWSAWTHGDPFAQDQGVFAKPREVLIHCYRLYARMLLRVADDMILTAEQYEFLRMNAEPFA